MLQFSKSTIPFGYKKPRIDDKNWVLGTSGDQKFRVLGATGDQTKYLI